MELNVETVETEDPNYSIVRTEQNGIKIAEINEKGCDYHDFVVLFYKAAKENIPLLEQFHAKYKKTEKTVCFIGCISDESDYRNDYSEFYKYFDLNGVLVPDWEFESLVLSCYCCRGGLTHGDPQDWINLKKEDSGIICCLEKEGKSFNEALNKLRDALKTTVLKYFESKKMKNAIVSVLSNGTDVSMSELQNINKLTEFLAEDYSMIFNVNTNCSQIDENTVRITLI